MIHKDDKSVCLIVPAYNEARTVSKVLSTAVESGMFAKVICVDDGSIDNTYEAASNVKSVVVIKQTNSGKAIALRRGLKEAGDLEILCFLDADLTNLTIEHIKALVTPVMDNDAQATIGIFSGGRGATDFAQRVAPMISGQRCLLKSLLCDFNKWDVRFGIEHALNDHLKSKGVNMLRVELVGASHIMKEEKRGFISGFIQRMRMYYEIFKYNFTKRM